MIAALVPVVLRRYWKRELENAGMIDNVGPIHLTRDVDEDEPIHIIVHSRPTRSVATAAEGVSGDDEGETLVECGSTAAKDSGLTCVIDKSHTAAILPAVSL